MLSSQDLNTVGFTIIKLVEDIINPAKPKASVKRRANSRTRCLHDQPFVQVWGTHIKR